MSPPVYIVVGSGYSAFANNQSVLTFEDIEPELSSLDSRYTLVLGQGLSEDQRRRLMELGEASPAAPRVICGELASPRSLTHKALAQNVLCSELVRLQGSTYRSTLLVNSLVDRLCDHTTGQHVNGMLLIEATRQVSIAAIESHYLRSDARKWGFSWSRCDTRFLGFAFPVPTDIIVQLPEIESFAQRQQVPITISITVEQAGTTVCEVLMELTMIEAALVEKLESRRAKRVIASVLSSATESVLLAQPA